MPEWMDIPALDDAQPEKQIHTSRYEYAAQALADKRVLDCACGMGYGTKILSGSCNAVGVDIDPEAINQAQQQYSECQFTVGDLYTVPMAGYDAFVSFETLEHLDRPEKVIARLPESVTDIVVSVPIRPTVGWNPWHKSDFTHGSFCRMIESVFRIVHVIGQPWIDGKGDLYLVVHGRRGAWTL